MHVSVCVCTRECKCEHVSVMCVQVVSLLGQSACEHTCYFYFAGGSLVVQSLDSSSQLPSRCPCNRSGRGV